MFGAVESPAELVGFAAEFGPHTRRFNRVVRSEVVCLVASLHLSVAANDYRSLKVQVLG